MTTITNNCKRCGKPFDFECPQFLIDCEGLHPDTCDDCYPEAHAEELAEEKKRQAENDRIRINAMLENSNIPADLRDYDMKLGNPSLVQWISDNRSNWLWIGGHNRIGKTRAAAHAAYQTITQSKCPAIYINAPLDLGNYMAMKRIDAESAENWLHRLCTVPLLVIDDLGKETYSDAKAEAVWTIIDTRVVNSLRTWITTNMNGEELAKRYRDVYGVGLVNRLREVCREYTPTP